MSLLREAEQCLAKQRTFASLNAFITPLQSSSSTSSSPWMQRVKDADARRGNASPKSSLDGKLVAVKDNICTREFRTTCASGMLDKFTSPFNATVVEALEGAGAIVAGKTNLDEFGMGSHSTNSYFGPTKNFISVEEAAEGGEDGGMSAGGSSGGSAVAVATAQCHAALGTDTGGSVRLPAAFTGIVGYKPSYGLISRWGVVAYANSLDTVGVMAPNTTVARDLFRLLNHFDHHDPTSIASPTRSRIAASVKAATKFRKGRLRIGVPVEYNTHELTPAVQHAWQHSLHHLHRQGHTIHPVSLPATRHALSAYYVLAPAEASSNLGKYDGVRYGTRDTGILDSAGGYLYAQTRGTGFGAEVKRRIVLGTFTLSADSIDNYFIQAQKVRRLVQNDFNSVFGMRNPLHPRGEGEEEYDPAGPDGYDARVDVLVCPTAPSPPPTMRALEEAPPVQAYMGDVLTAPASLAGLPALSVPAPGGASESYAKGEPPVGIQVIGQYGDDELVLDVGSLLERTN